MDDGPLQSLGCMEGHEVDSVGYSDGAVVGPQRRAEGCDRGVGVQAQVVVGELQEGLDRRSRLGRVLDRRPVRPNGRGLEVAQLSAGLGHAGGEARTGGPRLQQGRDLGLADQAALTRGGHRDAVTQQRPPERLELRVGPGQYCLTAPPRTGPVAVPHGPGQDCGLVGPVADTDGGLVPRRPHRGLGRASQQPPGRGQNLRRRPEVGAHVQHCAAWQVLADGIDQAGIGAVPAVDGLVGVTDHHQRRVRPQP